MRAVETLNLLLVLLILLSFLSLAVKELLVSDGSHLLGIAILNIESILTLEEHIPCKIFSHAALILFFEVDEGLLSAWDHVHSADLALACSREVDLQLILGGTWWEVLHEETEEHDGLLILEIIELQFSSSLRLLFSLSNIKIGKTYSVNTL